ncbi:MAG: sigma 54-interacting transcriptional regulator [bacterium]|nr:sigma 54-interacting transcriptional regulator [bacterium]
MSGRKAGPNEVILDSIADGVFTVDRNWRITFFNRAAEEITGVPRGEAVGRRCSEVFRASICEGGCALRHTMETGRKVVSRPIYIIDAGGRRVPVSISTAVLRDARGRIAGGVETFRDVSVVEELRKEILKRRTLFDIVSGNREMQRIMGILPDIARSGATVLLEGESGTGKELFARAIHHLSPRKGKPLVAVNCGALPDTLLESELFGYKAGAFTDARRDKPGRFAAAEGGTIFLDEIGDVSPALQSRLLRVLQEKVYEPLGSVRPARADVRVIAATNRRLADLVREGRFREDLYYRVNVISIVIPPLRDRPEDIPLLAEHFIERFNRLQGRNVSRIAPETLALLLAHPFPGNVRELENIIERAFVLCGGEVITPAHLPEGLAAARRGARPARAPARSLRDLEASFILDALERNGWNRLATARELGMHKTTLYRKIHALGIALPGRDGRRKGG